MLTDLVDRREPELWMIVDRVAKIRKRSRRTREPKGAKAETLKHKLRASAEEHYSADILLDVAQTGCTLNYPG